jgi:hypothetical protein
MNTTQVSYKCSMKIFVLHKKKNSCPNYREFRISEVSLYYSTHFCTEWKVAILISCSFFIPLPHFKLAESWSYNILCNQCVHTISVARDIQFHCMRCSKGLNIIFKFGLISI